MKLEFTKEWCMRMANLEGDSEIGAGKPMDDLTERLRDLDKKGYQPLTGAIGEEAADTIDRLRAEVASLKAYQCTSPWEDSPPCRGIQRQLDIVADLTQQLAEYKRQLLEALERIEYLKYYGEDA